MNKIPLEKVESMLLISALQVVIMQSKNLKTLGYTSDTERQLMIHFYQQLLEKISRIVKLDPDTLQPEKGNVFFIGKTGELNKKKR